MAFLMALPGWAAQPPARAKSLLGRGISAFEGVRFEEAESLLSEAIAAHPGWKTASGFRAMSRWTSGDLAGAQRDAKPALGLKPDAPESFAARGFARFVVKQYGLASDDFRKASQMDGGYALARFGLGSVMSQRGQAREALGHLDEAVRLAPKAPLFRVARGAVRDRLKDYGGAIEDYDAVLRLAGGFQWAYFYRGRDLRELRRFPKALEDLSKFLKSFPENKDALYVRSNIHFQMGNYPDAIRDLDRFILLDPGNALAYANRGVARGQAGDKQGAVADLERAKELMPGKAEQIDDQIRRLSAGKRKSFFSEEREEPIKGVAAEALPVRGRAPREEPLEPPEDRRSKPSGDSLFQIH